MTDNVSGIEQLTKLAEDLTERVASLETENAALKQQTKTASVEKQAPVVSDATAQATCEALLKAGALTEEQIAPTKQAFLNDPEAAHRTICGILDAQAQAKEASEQHGDLSGGHLVDGNVLTKSAEDSFFDNMQRILNIKF